MSRKTNNQKVASSVRGSVEKFSGDIESLSSQIANLTDAIISEKNLTASKIKSERELLAKKTALRNLKEDIDDLRSERKKNQDKLDKLLADAESEAQKEKEELRKKETQYSDSAKKSFEGGQFISGMIFKFLGRNEKDKKQIEVERQADKQAQIEELQNRSKALKEQTSTLKGLRTNIIGLNTNIIESEEERKYEQRDAEKVASEVSKFASVKLLDIEPEALSKLEKIFKSSVSEKENSNTLSDILSSSRGLLTFLSSTAGIAGIATTLTAIAALVSTKFKTDEYVAEENKKAIKDQETSTKLIEGRITESKALEELKTNAEGSNLALGRLNAAPGDMTLQVQDEYAAKTRLMKIYDEEVKKKFGTTLQTPTETLKQWLESDKQKLSIETDSDIRKKLEERIKYNESVLSGRNTTPIPSGPSVQKVETPESVPTQAAPQKVETPESVPTQAAPQKVEPTKPVPSIGIPKAGAVPTAQVESSFIDRVLGEIGSFLPTGVGSLTPTAMAATTKYTPTKAPEKQKLPFEELVGKLVKSESSGKSDIINAIGAAGLYQFTQGTAMEQIKLMKNKGIREDITKKFEGKESSSIGKDPILKYISEAKGKDGDTQQNRIKDLKKQGKIASDFDITSYIRKQYPNSVAATVASLNQEEQAAMYEQFLDPLIKAKGGKDKVDFADIKAYGFASGTYPAALRANNMNLPVYDFNTEQGKNVLSKNPFMSPWDTNKDGILTAQELRDATSLMDPSIKSGSQIYAAAANNKAIQHQTQGNNVFAVNNTNVVNQQKFGGKIRETPPSTYNPQDRTLHSITRTGA